MRRFDQEWWSGRRRSSSDAPSVASMKATFTSEWAWSKSPEATLPYRVAPRSRSPSACRVASTASTAATRGSNGLLNIAVNDASVAGRLEAAARPAAAAPAAAEAAESAATTATTAATTAASTGRPTAPDGGGEPGRGTCGSAEGNCS